MYMLRAYQSPCSGTHCAVQCAQIPNLASRNQSGARYSRRDSQSPRKTPGAMVLARPPCARIHCAAGKLASPLITARLVSLKLRTSAKCSVYLLDLRADNTFRINRIAWAPDIRRASGVQLVTNRLEATPSF